MRRGRYRIVLTPEKEGGWSVSVREVPGCHTHGRTIGQARARVREALELWVDDADSAELVDDLRIPKRAAAAIRRSRESRRDAERARSGAQAATGEAARVLVEELKLGFRDAGELLGVSHQRVAQVLGSGKDGRGR